MNSLPAPDRRPPQYAHKSLSTPQGGGLFLGEDDQCRR